MLPAKAASKVYCPFAPKHTSPFFPSKFSLGSPGVLQLRRTPVANIAIDHQWYRMLQKVCCLNGGLSCSWDRCPCIWPNANMIAVHHVKGTSIFPLRSARSRRYFLHAERHFTEPATAEKRLPRPPEVPKTIFQAVG